MRAASSPARASAQTARASAATTGQKLFYGVNGHPLQGGIYSTISQAQQIDYLNDIGFTVYRIDVGSTSQADTLAGWAAACLSAGVQVLPCLAPTFDYSDPTASYDDGYALGYGIAAACAPYCDVYECGNELDVAPGMQAAGSDGASASLYDQGMFIATREVIRGMIDGVKAAQPGARCISNGCAVLDIAFVDMLWGGSLPDGTNGQQPVYWDCTGWHWYQSSGDILNGGTWLNVPAYLDTTFSKPIWLTEVGAAPGQVDEQGQADYLQDILTEYYGFRTGYGVENICIYELISYAASGALYGLLGTDGVTQNPGYQTVKEFIAANPV